MKAKKPIPIKKWLKWYKELKKWYDDNVANTKATTIPPPPPPPPGNPPA